MPSFSASFTPEKTRLGWIGTGVMGTSMCRRLMDAGYSMTVFNRTRSKTDSLASAGAKVVDSPAEVASVSDIVLMMVGYPQDVSEVVLGSEGVLSADDLPQVLVDLTTSRPQLAVEISGVAENQGVHTLDAPVSGGDIGAREGRLSIMVGGDVEVFNSLDPIWKVLGQTVVHQGAAGAGQHTKMVNQTLIASGMIGVCEALLYAQKAGLDIPTVLRSVSSGAAGSWSLSNLAPRMVANDFDPGFYVEHFLKDMGIALEEAARMDLCLPGLALANQLYRAVQAQGHGRDGTQALLLALANLNGVNW